MAEIYLKFEEPGITGSSTAAGHEGEIEVLSWSHGAAGSQSLSLTKNLDSATNELIRHSFSVKPFLKATLTCYRPDGAADNKPVEYLRVMMERVVISHYSVSEGPGGVPIENVVVNFGFIQYIYKEK